MKIISDTTSVGQRYFVDGLSVSVVLGTLSNALPAIAALLTVIWTAIRIYETRSVQQLLGRAVPPQEPKHD